MALGVDGVEHGQPHLLRRLEVLGPIRRGGVDDACAILRRYIISRHHAPGSLGARIAHEVRIEWLVRLPDEVCPGIAFHHLILLLEHRQPRLGEDQKLLLTFAILRADRHIVDLRPDGEGGVGNKRPRRGRPGEEIRVRRLFGAEADVDARVLHFLISEADLMRGEHRVRARAIPLNLKAFVEQVLVVHLLEQPPHRLHVFRVEGDVRVFEIHPIAHQPGEFVPLLDVLEDTLFTSRIVRLDPVFLHLMPPCQPQRFFHLNLHREAMRIPSTFPVHTKPFHRMIAAEDILDRTGHHMMDAGASVGRRRAFVEGVRGGVFVLCYAFLKDIMRVPPLKDFTL